MDVQPYPDEFFEEAARRESARREAESREKAMKAVDKLYEENSGALQRLAEIEKEERMTEDQRIKAIQTAVGGINKYSDALKELAKSEKEELKQQLEDLKKQNFQNLSKVCMEEYTGKYGERPEDEYFMFLESTFFGTGNGHTTSLLITSALPSGEDYDKEAEYPQNYEPINSQEYRAVREFHSLFGTFALYGLRFHSKEAFFEQYGQYIPPIVARLKDEQCYKHFHTEVHYNYS